MELQDFTFMPHNDVGIDDINAITQHKNLISQENYEDAGTLAGDHGAGFVASLFNGIQNKIRTIQLYLLNEFVAESDEYYSDAEPDTTFMKENGYVYWIKPF